MKLKSVLLASAVLAGLPGLASAEPNDSWYGEIGAGVNWLNDITGINDRIIPGFGVTHDQFESTYDTGWIVDGAIGYKWDIVRLELELAYRSNDQDTFRMDFFGPPFAPLTSHPAIGGDVTTFAQMVNLVIDLPLGDSGVDLSLGGGAGGAFVEYSASGHVVFSGTDFVLESDDYAFAYQAIAGLSFDIGDHTELFGEYRYFKVNNVDADGLVIVPGPDHTISTDDIDVENHSALFGLRWYFGEEEVVPVDNGPPPPPTTDFSLYFTKKDVLTAEGQATLQEAADAHKGGADVVTVHVEGGGSRAGDVVTRALVDLGVEADKISVSPDGTTVTITK